jgi:CBS domain containing-hemolysin-like protein
MIPRHERRRNLLSEGGTSEEEIHSFDDDPWFYLLHAAGAFACVTTAALAAGLTMGLLSLDPLMLLIKMRAGATQREKDQAAALLPIVKQHHLLLVTLLLLNSIANEALPLFLEVLVSPIVAVILSVTFVLFFGEIIPSAVFTYVSFESQVK